MSLITPSHSRENSFIVNPTAAINSLFRKRIPQNHDRDTSFFYLLISLLNSAPSYNYTVKKRSFERLAQLRSSAFAKIPKDEKGKSKINYNLLRAAGYSCLYLIDHVFSNLNGYSDEKREYIKTHREEFSLPISNICFNTALIEKLEFQKADWSPKSSAKELIFILKNSGYIVVFGQMGAICSDNSFESSEKIAEIPVFELEKRSIKFGTMSSPHTGVLVIGVKIRDDKEFIYFINPTERGKSDPFFRIYKMPYCDFCDMATNFHALPYSKANAHTIFSLSAPAKQFIKSNENIKTVNILLEWEGPTVTKDKKKWINRLVFEKPEFLKKTLEAKVSRVEVATNTQSCFFLLNGETKEKILRVSLAFFQSLKVSVIGFDALEEKEFQIQLNFPCSSPNLIPNSFYSLVFSHTENNDDLHISADLVNASKRYLENNPFLNQEKKKRKI